MASNATEHTCLGIDLGTSGVRAAVIDSNTRLIASAERPWSGSNDDPSEWWRQTSAVIGDVVASNPGAPVGYVAVDGTSTSLLLTDAGGEPVSEVLMYNDDRCTQEAADIAATAPPDTPAHGVTSSLAKLLYLQNLHPEAQWALHQSDWVTSQLTGQAGFSDENNAIKLGYDAQQRCWPDWLTAWPGVTGLLPGVVPPGTALGSITPDIAAQLGLSPTVTVVAGTTDGVAAFVATGATQAGDAVTSLGSTLVLKLLSPTPITAPEFGVYSHRLGQQWLAGGASNSGGNVLAGFFSPEQMLAMTPQLRPEHPTGCDLYPLLSPGERFPVSDPKFKPRLTPRPDTDTAFFQALLEGIADIEQQGYALLAQLGAGQINAIRTVGKGASNTAWTKIRESCLGVPSHPVRFTDAAAGAAIVASWAQQTP